MTDRFVTVAALIVIMVVAAFGIRIVYALTELLIGG